MECLRDTVGILGCGAPDPSEALYVNDLPGITSFMVGKIANQEQVTYLAVWNNIQDRAIKKFNSSVVSAFKNYNKLKIKTIAQSANIGRVIDASTTTAPSAQYRGIAIELVPAGTNYPLYSALQVIYVQSVSIYSTAVHAGFEIKIFDLQTGDVLETLTEDLAVGWNLIRVNGSYEALRILIAYNATAFTSATLTLTDYAESCCQLGCDALYGYGNCTASINGAATADLSDVTTIDKGSDTYGLSAIFFIQCRYDVVVCNNKDQFIIAWQYLLGSELMTERIYSDRENRYTGIDLEKAKEIRNEFDTAFNAELEKAVQGVDISEMDCCVECVATIQKPYIIP